MAKIRDLIADEYEENKGQFNLAELFNPYVPELTRRALQRYGEALVSELQAGLGAPLTELATRGANSRRMPLRITVESDQPAWSLEIWLRRDSVQYKVNMSDDFGLKIFEDLSDDTEPLWFFDAPPSVNVGRVLGIVLDEVTPRLFSDFPGGAHYLPAARAGLLQGHRLVAAAMVQRTPLIGLGEMSMPALSGVVADFISEILLSDVRGLPRKARRGRLPELARIANEIEEAVLHGKVQQVNTGAGYPEIEFEDSFGRYPIHRTSSMVSELAPIVLLLRRSVQDGDLLIIEEPESHLHPETQTKLARILYSAANVLPIFVTTHSDYFLSQVNNEMRNQQLQRGQITTPTGAYWMKRMALGSAAQKLPIDGYDGIPEDSFTAVASTLYDEQVDQQLKLSE